MTEYKFGGESSARGSSAARGGSVNERLASMLEIMRIETKRSVGLLLFPLLLLAAWYIASSALPTGVYLWFDTSSAVQESVIFLGPLVGGLSAWMASRSRRRGMEEMLAITPLSSAVRDLTAWAGTAFWGVAVYVLLAAVLSVLTWRNATWGGPLPGFLLVGLLGLISYSALGWAAGYWVPGRFTAPLSAIGISVWELALVGPTGIELHLTLLSPVPVLLSPDNWNVFREVPQVTVQQSLWFIGLGGVALAIVALKNAWASILVWVALLGFAVVAAVGFFSSIAAGEQKALNDSSSAKYVPFKPVCEKGEITVCVHSAYKSLLPKTAKAINEVAAPVAGISGVPDSALPSSDAYRSGKTDVANSFAFDPISITWEGGMEIFKQEIAWSLVQSEASSMRVFNVQAKPSAEDKRMCGAKAGEASTPAFAAQDVVGRWLLRRAGSNAEGFTRFGFSHTGPSYPAKCPNIDKLTDRFAKLTSTKQKAWLEKNYADLRASKLTLKDLP